MTLSLCKTRSINNSDVLQKFHSNSLLQLKNYQKSENSDLPIQTLRYTPNGKIFGKKQLKMAISINYNCLKQKKYTNNIQDCSEKIDSSQNQFYQIFMEQSTVQSYSNSTFNHDQNKENDMNLVNYSFFNSSPQNLDQMQDRVNKIEKVINEGLMQNYSKAMKNIKKLDRLEKQTNAHKTAPTTKKIKLIQELIEKFQTNKHMRIREMFQQRQRLSESREQEKKAYLKKLEKVKDVELKFKNRDIGQYKAVSELNKIQK